MIDRERMRRLHRILRHQAPVAALAREAAERRVETHLVGGVLRDRLLGLPSRDYDAVVSGAGLEIAGVLAGRLGAHLVRLGGKDFSAYRLVAAGGEGWVLDIWDREGAALAADLARRDFTVNSLALPLAAEPEEETDLIDLHGGLADLERRLLRATRDDSFTGDPLRVLRLPRLLVQLPGFTAHPGSLELARTAAPGLAAIASERVREELVLIFQREAAGALGVLVALGVYPGLWRGAPGAVESAAGERRAGHAALEIERLEARGGEVLRRVPGAPRIDRLAGRVAATFAHLPEQGPAERRTAQAVAAVERFRDAGYLTRHLATRVALLVESSQLPADERDRRRFLHRLGPLWPTAVARLGAAHPEGPALSRWRAALAELAALLARDGRRILDPPRLLGGDDVQRLLGVAPGPDVGRALDRVRQAQVDGEVATRREAEALLLRRRA